MNCCHGNCDQGRNCPVKTRPPKQSGDWWKIMALLLAPFAVLCIAALVGGRIAGMW